MLAPEQRRNSAATSGQPGRVAPWTPGWFGSIRTLALGVSTREYSGIASRLRGWFYSAGWRDRRILIGPRVELIGRRNIHLADRVALYGNSYLNAARSEGYIRIGENTHVDQFCVLYGQGGLSIGAKCAIASGVTIYSQTNTYEVDPLADIIDQPVVYKPVSIGNDVWICSRAVILPGISVGDHAVIAAGAIVKEDVSPWTVVAGSPAKPIRDRRSLPSQRQSKPTL